MSTFFTNHVASSMHRYWPATFPNDYTDFSMSQKWQDTYKNEIWHALGKADFHIKKLLDFIERNRDFTLIIASSMGQSSVNRAEKIENQLLLTEPELLMDVLGIGAENWEQKLAMAPQCIFRFQRNEDLNAFLSSIGTLRVRNVGIEAKSIGDNSVRISFGHANFNLSCDEITLGDELVAPRKIGLEVVNIQDESGSYAYHIPEGILLIFNGGKNDSTNDVVSTTQIAPSILKHFGIGVPKYMENPTLVF